jgi:hypothetical protein
MFVRWKYRRLRRRRDVTCKAILVRSVWRHGQPRQHIVCYLAAIHAQHLQAPAHRQAFWQLASERLATVPLDVATRQRVMHQLATMVPPPTVEELQQVRAQQAVLQELATQLAPSAPIGALGLGARGHPDGSV